MSILHVSLSFTRLPDAALDDFAETIDTDMTGNAAFATPPVQLPALAAARQNFEAAMAAMAQGGPASTAAKNAARETLIGLLRQLAAYVEQASKNDLAVLLSSGFFAASSNHAQTALPKASIKSVKNGASGQLIAEANTMDNAHGWEARVTPAGGAAQPAQSLKASRKMTIINLVPGTMYAVEMRAQGGSTGYSDWSDPVSHRCL